MPSPELQRLYRLHEADEQILKAKTRLASLDGGKARVAELREIKGRFDAADERAKSYERVAQEATDQRATGVAKADDLEKELYSGRITSPREVDDRQRQIDAIRKAAAALEERIPALQADAKARRKEATPIKEEFDAARRDAQIEVKRQQGLAEKLSEWLAKNEPKRESYTEGIPKTLLDRYEKIRARHAGIGMAKVVLKPGPTCEACGNAVPERVMTSLLDDKVATCEACHRLLYYTLGVV